jgi:hypothetical protein
MNMVNLWCKRIVRIIAPHFVLNVLPFVYLKCPFWLVCVMAFLSINTSIVISLMLVKR